MWVDWLVGFFRRVLLRSSGCQGAYYVDQADHGLKRPVCLCLPNSGVKSKFWTISLWHHTQPWLAFLNLCIFYTLILYWMNSWQRFPPILKAICLPFFFFSLMRSHLSVAGCTSCEIGVLFNMYKLKQALCFSLELFVTIRLYAEVFDPFGVEFCVWWERRI